MISIRPLAADDEISEVLGDRRYAAPYYDRGLRNLLLGRHSRDLVAVSRYYLLLVPPVIVDIEPPPGPGRFWVDEKRRYFSQLGIAYVPVFLGERLTADEFRRRVAEAREVVTDCQRVAREAAELARARIPVCPEDPEIARDRDAEALRIVQAEVVSNSNLRGASRLRRLRAVRRGLQVGRALRGAATRGDVNDAGQRTGAARRGRVLRRKSP